MKITDLIATLTGVISIISAAAGVTQFLVNNSRNKSLQQRKSLIMHCVLTAMLAVAFVMSGVAVYTLFLHPQVTVNNQAAIPIPGLTRHTPSPVVNVIQENKFAETSMVTVTPTTASDDTTSKTYSFNRSLTCLTSCQAQLGLILSRVVVDPAQQNTAWYFIVTNKGSSTCSSMYTSVVVQDGRGQKIAGGPPGTLTQQGLSLDAGQTQERDTTVPLVPKSGSSYLLKVSSSCEPVATNATYLIETLTFN